MYIQSVLFYWTCVISENRSAYSKTFIDWTLHTRLVRLNAWHFNVNYWSPYLLTRRAKKYVCRLRRRRKWKGGSKEDVWRTCGRDYIAHYTITSAVVSDNVQFYLYFIIILRLVVDFLSLSCGGSRKLLFRMIVYRMCVIVADFKVRGGKSNFDRDNSAKGGYSSIVLALYWKIYLPIKS